MSKPDDNENPVPDRFDSPMNNPEHSNHRILVIDDNRAIHDDFRKILLTQNDDVLDRAGAELFGDAPTTARLPRFEVDSAFQGQEGLDCAQRALQAGRPYAVAFVDVRMPPGLDGIETTAKLWQIDPDLQVVLCTAYSDYSWEEMIEKVGNSDRLVILKKPFDTIEVVQLANALTEKWLLLQRAKRKFSDLEEAVAERTRELEQSRVAALNMMEDAVDARGKAEAANEDLQRQITERKQLEEHLRQAQKMEAIGQLAGGIAHDFNNILGCIFGYTELAAMEVKSSPAVQENLQEVLKASQRAKELVQQILTFSRQQEQERRSMKLQPVIKEALKLLRASLPSTIEIRADIQADAPPVMADATQMHQIVMNLATNAAHAMSGRPGQLAVRLAKVEVDDRMVQAVPDLRTGVYVVLAISDTGCGMDKAILDRIFEPFFTTKAPGEGTGLGLSVVHGIVKSHDGAIAVQSQAGKGTTIQVYFPSQQTSDTEVFHRSGPIPKGNGEQVMFVDDEPALALLGKKLLERAGYHVTIQTSAPEALKVFRTDPGRYDLIVTDLTMPNLTGADLAGELLKIRPELPIIMATGFSGSMNSAKAQALGVRELLMKPLTCQALAESAHRVLAQKKTD